MQVPTRIPDPSDLGRLAAAAGLERAVLHLGRLDGVGAWSALDDGRWIYPASLIKLPIAVALEAHVAAGRVRHTDVVEVAPSNMTVNDLPSPLAPGCPATLDQLEELMLTQSDNVATNVLIDVLGRERATEHLVGLGLAATAVRRKLSGALPLIDDPEATGRNSHPAREAAQLLAAIARDGVPGAARLRAILARQAWNEKLPQGLAPGDVFAHKTGDTDEVCHDAGILVTREARTYVVVVYTEVESCEANDQRLAAFMRELRPLL